METTRKTWISPQVFVLGAENTLSGELNGTNEGATQEGEFCFDHDNDPLTPNYCVTITVNYYST